MHTISFSMNASDTSRSSLGGLPPDRHIGCVTQHVLEHVLTVSDDERQIDAGVLLGELPHHTWHERLSRSGDRRDVEPAGRDC